MNRKECLSKTLRSNVCESRYYKVELKTSFWPYVSHGTDLVSTEKFLRICHTIHTRWDLFCKQEKDKSLQQFVAAFCVYWHQKCWHFACGISSRPKARGSAVPRHPIGSHTPISSGRSKSNSNLVHIHTFLGWPLTLPQNHLFRKHLLLNGRKKSTRNSITLASFFLTSFPNQIINS